MIDWVELFSRKRITFHCETEDIAIEFLKIAHEHGHKLCNGKSFLEKNDWNKHHGNRTCYDISCGMSSSVEFETKLGYTIINVSELLYERNPFKLNRK